MNRKLAILLFAMFLLISSLAAVRVWMYRPAPPDANRLVRYAEAGNTTGVEFCLRHGLDPNGPEKWGWRKEKSDGQTPLTAAAQHGRSEVVRLLIARGADVNLRDFGPDYPHSTPLSTAAAGGHVEVCEILLGAGADPNKPSERGWTALDWALQAKQRGTAELLRRHGAVESGRREFEQP